MAEAKKNKDEIAVKQFKEKLKILESELRDNGFHIVWFFMLFSMLFVDSNKIFIWYYKDP